MAGLIVKSKLFDKRNLLFTDIEFWDLQGIELPDGYDDLKKEDEYISGSNKKVSDNNLPESVLTRTSNISDKDNLPKNNIIL